MKLILLAAAAVIAMPAFAQTGTMTSDPQTTTTPTPNSPTQTMPSQAPTDGTMPSGSMPSGSMAPSGTSDQSMPMQTTGATPAGGYQPSTMPTGASQAGGTVRFQQAPSPDQAYPAPAPMASYPICKKGEFDKCMQGPRSTHSREVRGRRSM